MPASGVSIDTRSPEANSIALLAGKAVAENTCTLMSRVRDGIQNTDAYSHMYGLHEPESYRHSARLRGSSSAVQTP